MQYPGLMRRGARWYLRVKVPADLRSILGRDQIWKALGTSDRREAIGRYFPARTQLQATFEQARRLHLSPDDARRMVTEWLHTLDRQTAHADFELCGPDLSEAMAELDQELFELRAGADVTNEAHRMLIQNGWPAQQHKVGSIRTRHMVPVNPPDVDVFVRRALIEHTLRRRDRLNRQPATTYDPAFAVKPVSEITLADLIDRFTADKVAHLSSGKVLAYQALFRLLRELWGDAKPVREIDRANCRQVRDVVSSLPPHASKRWPRLTLIQAAEHARQHGIPPMDPATANAYLSRLSTLMGWGLREELIGRNPAVGLRVAEPEGDPRHARNPFSLDQLQRIVSGLPAEPVWHRWTILLGMFTGCRLNEVCGLATADITEQDGVPVILIRPDTRTLKTASARRTIPIHPMIRSGFLAYVAGQRAAGHERLFPELTMDSRGRFSDACQKRFSRFLARIGAKAPRTSYHSFRHGFRDALREAQASDEIVDALLGWTRRTMRETYGSGPRISALAEAVARVRYDGLDLSHLRRKV
jgi:integrase